MNQDESMEDRRAALEARIDELLDERRDPLDDAELALALEGDEIALQRVAALQAALRALPRTLARPRRGVSEFFRPLLVAAALVVVALLLSRSQRAGSESEAAHGAAVLAYHLTATTWSLDRCIVEESDRFGIVRRTETLESPELRLVCTETRR